MFSKIKLKQLVIIGLILGIGFLSYRYFLKDFYWNNQTQHIKVENLALHEVFELNKHADQSAIHSLEIELRGKASENVTFYLGESPQSINQVITVKKGSIDYKASFDWYEGQSYIIFIGDPANYGKVTLDYRFIGSSY
jgi:hypothetical protein